MSKAKQFLERVNSEYLHLHKQYEDLFWSSYMGARTDVPKREKAHQTLDRFRNNSALRTEAVTLLSGATPTLKKRLQIWIDFFDLHQMSNEAQALKSQIATLESYIENVRASHIEGYIDPQSKKFVPASTVKMNTMIMTHPDERVRKACFIAREKLALDCIGEYVELVKLRNQFAKLQGYEDFYDYKLKLVDKMSKSELFSLFDALLKPAQNAFQEIRIIEKQKKGLRKPWNFNYLMSGDFITEEDPYFQFDQALKRWGTSFAAMGIDFKGGTLQLDLLERPGKYNNGFCHWPDLVNFKDGIRQPGSANFTCLLVPGQIGSGDTAYKTLFHEGGHAAHFLNCEQLDVCLNHEYAPMTAGWAETQSMFIDTAFDSIEWKTRYARNAKEEVYPFELFERKIKALHLTKQNRILRLAFIAAFERDVYELEHPTVEKIKKIAKANYKKYYDLDGDSLLALNVPHIYSWESACAYHGYGLATFALSQWREYFYKKYGYIVDNPNIGKEMKKVWKLGSAVGFKACVKLATGKKFSSQALVKELSMTPNQTIKMAKTRLKKMETIKPYTKTIDLKATIKMVHGKKIIADSTDGFEMMTQKYAAWVNTMKKANSRVL